MKSVSAGVQVAGRFGQVRAVDIGDEAEVDRTVTVEFEGFIGHHRSQVGAADADVDHVADPLARMALPVAAADLAGEIRHLVQHGMDLGHHVFAVHDNPRIPRRTQSHVQDGAVFGEIDSLAPEHGVDPRSQADLLRQLQEKLDRFVVDPILRIIEVDPGGLGRHAFASARIIAEEFPHVDVPNFPIMGFETIPGRAGRGRLDAGRHSQIPFVAVAYSAARSTRSPPKNSFSRRP